MRVPEPISIMTASLMPGDAIGNYVLTLKRLWEQKGAEVRLYADHIAPRYATIAQPSDRYASGEGTLWYHYSIYAQNLAQLRQPAGLRIIDYHGVTPPHLFEEYDPHLANLCKRGLHLLPEFRDAADLAIVHSEYTRDQLHELGFRVVSKLPLVVDTRRFSGVEDSTLSNWLQRLPYLLFVGRLVPQKDILGLLEVFAHLHQLQPEAGLILVGGRQLAPGYQRAIERRVKHRLLKNRVLFTGQVNTAAMLTSLYRHARFTIITSEWESFCVPIVESMSFGTPVIVHDIPPLPEVMGGAGIIIDKHKPKAAAEAISALWQSREGYAQLVANCQERASMFTEAALASDMSAVFAEML